MCYDLDVKRFLHFDGKDCMIMDNNGIQILGILAMGFIVFCAVHKKKPSGK